MNILEAVTKSGYFDFGNLRGDIMGGLTAGVVHCLWLWHSVKRQVPGR